VLCNKCRPAAFGRIRSKIRDCTAYAQIKRRGCHPDVMCMQIAAIAAHSELTSANIEFRQLRGSKILCNMICSQNQNHHTTRNAFCRTWYLPHSHVNNERTVPIIMAGYIAHALTGRISTSGEKSDVTIVFLDPDFR